MSEHSTQARGGQPLPPLVDEEALRPYLAEKLPSEGAADVPLVVERIRGGHSNETFYVNRGEEQWVLRRPPRGPLLPTAHDVSREYRVLSALAQTDVPVPRTVLFCDDTSVIGAPFYLMERVPGVVIRTKLPPGFEPVESRRQLADTLIDTLADLHAVDYQAVGLGDFGKPQGYLERQLRRWTGQLDASRNRELPDLDAVTAWLQAHLPASGPATIVHGDYRMDNCMYAPEPPARILAVVDWEMATIGDPLADLGYLLSFWREPDDPQTGLLSDDSFNVSLLPGFPTRRELVRRYAERTGREMQSVDFYVALAIWKLAILLEGSYKRHLAGTTDDPFFATLGEGIPALARRALAVCHGELRLT
jgi:aminoglycoside phosphotransferase (APT) family kinase protein